MEMRICARVPSLLLFRALSIQRPSLGVLDSAFFEDLQNELKTPCTVEIVGGRRCGKSLFALSLVSANPALSPVLIITKGPKPAIPNCSIYTAAGIDSLIATVHAIITTYATTRTLLVVVDTLMTVIATEEGMVRREELFHLLKCLNALGVRVLVVNSTIHAVRSTSSFYAKSYVWGTGSG
ncbi:hypothetical protein NEDG_01632 [Nematocida displodere]|uniref:RecA family profile 1 domain-containing protein n=1 Tax=Nematocida displodere TaxID=1805483 RepID=A0A177EJQ7_9MICR|nr:hypothetical protein NEDG_01632 [Nematocida displodere]